MSENKIMTAPKKTVGAESGQPDKNINGYSITDPSFFDKPLQYLLSARDTCHRRITV